MKTDTSHRRPTRPTSFEGIGVSGGIAIGPAYVLEGGIAQVPEFAVEAHALEAEVDRFKAALAKARRQIRKLRRKAEALPVSVLEELGPLLDAHAAMLDSSRLAGGVESAIRTRSVNAEAAVQAVVGELVRGLEAVGDAYLASRGQDIREVGDRILRHLTATPYHAFALLTPGTIVVAEELSPADTALMDPAGSSSTPTPTPWPSTAARPRPASAWSANWPGCGRCRRPPPTASASPCRPTWSCRATWRTPTRAGPRASACCAPSSCS